MIQKILLFGESGMLGKYIYSYFKHKINIVRVNYKIIDHFDDLENMLDLDENTCVINCIGLIPQRNPTSDKDYFLINSIFPNVLWTICKKNNAKMIQPSTDCVFSGKKGGYVETDIPDETKPYGMSKSLGEPNCTVIRTSIIGKEVSNKKSFLEWVLSNNNDKINGITNHLWNGITCLEYCKIIEKMIDENMFWNGVRHIHSPTSVSKYELACIISNVFDVTIDITPVKSEPIDKTLVSNYSLFEIPELLVQMKELKDFSLI
jgi:dTDP-4-dehydrorhamnose reductase